MRSAARQRGLSIIELMIGIVVSLLVGLAAAGSAMFFTASQRQGVGVGGTMVNVGTVVSALKNDSANAGLGFFGDDIFLCNTLNLSVDSTLIADSASFAPLRITRGATSDSIDVVYSTQVHSGANVLLNTASDSTSAQLMSLLPVSVGQAVLLAPPTPTAGTACTVRTVSAVTPSTESTPQVLAFAAAASHNAATFSNAATLNYPERSRVALLGELRWNNYSVDGNGNLLLSRPLEVGSTPVVLARNVMSFRAQYGINDGTLLPNGAPSPTIESWQEADAAPFAALDSAAIGRVRALRIGIVTRSPQREKANAAGTCEASSAKPQLFGADVEPDVSDWQCFRFRSTTAVLPLRNLVLGIK